MSGAGDDIELEGVLLLDYELPQQQVSLRATDSWGGGDGNYTGTIYGPQFSDSFSFGGFGFGSFNVGSLTLNGPSYSDGASTYQVGVNSGGDVGGSVTFGF